MADVRADGSVAVIITGYDHACDSRDAADALLDAAAYCSTLLRAVLQANLPDLHLAPNVTHCSSVCRAC